MKPLFVLITVFLLTLGATKVVTGNLNWAFSGRLSLALMLLFTASAHFAFTKGMTAMVPPFVPYKKTFVYATGFLEIAAAAGIWISGLRPLTGWLLLVFFILLLPANVYAAIRHLDYQKGSFDGPGASYLWLRVPLQFFFMFWTYYFCIYK